MRTLAHWAEVSPDGQRPEVADTTCAYVTPIALRPFPRPGLGNNRAVVGIKATVAGCERSFINGDDPLTRQVTASKLDPPPMLTPTDKRLAGERPRQWADENKSRRTVIALAERYLAH